MQLQYIRSKQRLYTMDDLGQVIKDYECRSAIVPGYNGAGQERESLPNGNYTVSGDGFSGRTGCSIWNFLYPYR